MPQLAFRHGGGRVNAKPSSLLMYTPCAGAEGEVVAEGGVVGEAPGVIVAVAIGVGDAGVGEGDGVATSGARVKSTAATTTAATMTIADVSPDWARVMLRPYGTTAC